MIKAIIFDRDDVLLNSEAINIRSSKIAFEEQGISFTENDKQHTIALHPDDYIDYFLKKYTFDPKIFRKRKLNLFNNEFEILNSNILFSKTIETAKNLKKQGYLVGLATSSEKENTKKFLKKINLDSLFNIITTFDDCEKRKPHPDPYLITAKKLNVKPSECIVVEDSSIGAQAAKNAGMTCIAIPNEYTKNQDFSMVDYVVKSGSEIEDIIRSFVK